MYSQDDLLPISALQHLAFCERQCALIHIEQVWSENLFTAQGRVMHDRVHTQIHESRGNVRLAFGLDVRSLRLGLIGKADVVEFHREDASPETWRPFPVEYKRGRPKTDNCDRVQLCAQAMCLEEMLHLTVDAGAVFYGRTRRRQDVAFDAELRQETGRLTIRLHELINSHITPKAEYSPRKCNSCSLINACMPKAAGGSVTSYLADIMGEQ